MVAGAGLFVPLMDNDSAHHANIALHMYLTGDYVNLVDNGRDYLDKPHLHFWLSALSYQLFGLTGFAYKFPSFLFSLLAVYAVYRAGSLFYNRDTGRLSALLLASSLAFLLALNDVRMEIILTAGICLAGWQLGALILQPNGVNIAGAALGLAIGFSTKGLIGVFVPALAALLLISQYRKWRFLLSGRFFLLLIFFFFLISPVLYCYYLQFNLHPEKMIRGRDHINGVSFILFGQSVERYTGGMGDTLKNDYFFFLHSFLWVFVPWSVAALFAIANKFRSSLKTEKEWMSTGVFLLMILLLSFSGFKLPHYLVMLLPFAALFTADWFIGQQNQRKSLTLIYRIQLFISFLLLLVALLLNFWAFPVSNGWIMAGLVFLLAVFLHGIRSMIIQPGQKIIFLPVTATALLFFLLNTNFYPRLLHYQGGSELVFRYGENFDRKAVYSWKEDISASFQFYTGTLRKQFPVNRSEAEKPGWLLYYKESEAEVLKSGLRFGRIFRAADYEITRLDAAFLNPDKRERQCAELILAEILP